MKRAMDKLDLLVVIDPFPSATAAMAAMPGKSEDVNPKRAVYLLPACTQFETWGVEDGWKYGEEVLLMSKLVEPPGEAREDWRILCELAGRMGYPMSYRDAGEVQEEIASLTPSYGGITYERLSEAAARETGVDAEIVDLRSLWPLDLATLPDSERLAVRGW